MRTLVDIPEKDLKRLTRLSKSKKVSRAQLVRCAIADYLNTEKQDNLDESFGILAGSGIDGLEFQLHMRSEWDREF